MKAKLVFFTLAAIYGLAFSLDAFTTLPSVRAARTGREEIIQGQAVTFAVPKRAIAGLNPTKWNSADGLVFFDTVEGGLRIRAKVSGLPPGKHGFHIHEFGDIRSSDGALLGRHFNPTHVAHGGPDHLVRHAGDLGNLFANGAGQAEFERIFPDLSLTGPNSIMGLAIAVDYNPDDYMTQPTGNSGGHLATGLIVER